VVLFIEVVRFGAKAPRLAGETPVLPGGILPLVPVLVTVYSRNEYFKVLGVLL
jgi:hypothetical protein